MANKVKCLSDWLKIIKKTNFNLPNVDLSMNFIFSVFGILYLMSKHKSDCAILSPIDHKLINMKESKNNPYNLDNLFGILINGINIFFDEKTKKYYIIQTVTKKDLKQCDNPKIRYVIILFRFQQYGGKNTFAHFNVLIYDKKKNTVERFDPFIGHVFYTDLDRFIDNKLMPDILKKILPKAKYLSSVEFPVGVQQIQMMTQPKKAKKEPKGYCAAWSLFYADLRLTYPDIPREKLIRTFLKHSFDEDVIDNLTGFIKGYSQFVLKHKEEIQKKIPKKIIQTLKSKKASKEKIKEAAIEYLSYINKEISKMAEQFRN